MEILEYDVVVIGGGPAGSAAAIASARCGEKTLLVEQNGYLGGMLTAGGVGPQMTYHAGDRQVILGIGQEIIKNMVAQGFSPGHMPDSVGFCSSTTPFDSEGLKIVLETMAQEAGVDLLYHTTYLSCEMKEKTIEQVNLYSKNGMISVKAKRYIDASADADLATHAGVASVYGRESDHLAQPMTMNAKVYDVDREKMLAYVERNPEDVYSGTPKYLSQLPRYGISGAYSLIKEGKEAGDFTIDRDMVLCFETNNKGEFIVNMTRVPKKSALDPFALTKAEIEGRKQVQETVRFLQKYVPGFENCKLMFSGPQIGIRESRKIDGVYKLTADDLVNNVMFDDAVAMGGYPIDIHSPDGKETAYRFLKEGSWYSIPYRCLVTDKVENLLVAGRCISATHEACSAIRLTPIAMAVGQAAGTAAAQSIQEKVSVAQVDTNLLRAKLKENNVFLEEYKED